jgi:hypothetical protein
MLVSTALLICAVVTLAVPLLLLATPAFNKLPVVETIAFASLIGLFPLLAVSSVIAAIVTLIRTRVWQQPIVEVLIALILLFIAAFNGAP